MRILITALLLTIAFGAAHALADAPEASAKLAKLNLPNGDYVSGAPIASTEKNTLKWQGNHFTQPLEYSLGRIGTVHFPLPEPLPKPAGEYCFELAGDDVVFGGLVSLNADIVEVNSPRFGVIHLPRASIRRFYRWDGADLIYLGPNGLTGWSTMNQEKPWKEDGGQPISSIEGAIIRGDFGVPAQAVVEFEVSWKNKPDFALVIGDNGNDTVARQAFRFEVWIDDLIVQRELPTVADVASLQGIQPGAGRAHVIAYLDQTKGRMLVYAPSGQQLADLKVAEKDPKPAGGLMIENKRGDLRLERLRISRWNGIPPQDIQGSRARLHKADGSIIYGDITSYDAAKREFLVRDGQIESKLPANQLSTVLVSAPTTVEPRTMRAVCHDGTQISGDLLQLQDGKLSITTPGIQEGISIPIADLRTVVGLKRDEAAALPSEIRLGTLELDGTLLRGGLINGEEQADASCLIWRPISSSNAVPLKPGVSGRIVYRVPPPKPASTQPAPQVQRAVPRQAGLGGAIMQFLGNSNNNAPKGATGTKKPSSHTLHLRSGDTVPCEIVAIDEQGLSIKSDVAEAKLVPHDKVKAVELVTNQPPRLGKTKRERLLMLPRLQKDSPPTQLLRSINGDYLRGRLVSFSPDKLRMEVRLESKEIASNKIAQIIWFHPDELTENASSESKAEPNETKTRVQALKSDGIRLTFFPQHLKDKLLEGKSDVLGACRADISDVDQLILGPSIEKAAAELVYHQWKLSPPVEPRFVTAADNDGGDGRPSGLESPLVGKPAPIFELDQLDGKRFKLAETKGKVLVLDFWASWCGPCLQAMPEIHRTVHEFEDKPVALVGVNLEEPPSTVKATLERHKLNLTVAMDQDGVVALKYGATAIPQTVVIDAQGNVTRVFVGGGPKLAEDLKAAIEEALNKGTSPEPPQKPAT